MKAKVLMWQLIKHVMQGNGNSEVRVVLDYGHPDVVATGVVKSFIPGDRAVIKASKAAWK